MVTFEQEEWMFVEGGVGVLKLGERRMMKLVSDSIAFPALWRQLAAERQDEAEYTADDFQHRQSFLIQKTPAKKRSSTPEDG